MQEFYYGLNTSTPEAFLRSDHDRVRAFLLEQGLFGRQFLYRGFDLSRLPILRATGTDRDESSVPDSRARSSMEPYHYLCATPILGEFDQAMLKGNIDWAVNQAFFEGRSGLSVYDASKLERMGPGYLLHKEKPEFSFMDALSAIIIPEI